MARPGVGPLWEDRSRHRELELRRLRLRPKPVLPLPAHHQLCPGIRRSGAAPCRNSLVACGRGPPAQHRVRPRSWPLSERSNLGAPPAIENQDVPQRAAWDLGASFSLQPRDEIFLQVLSIYLSPALWASWNFSEHVTWDTAVLRSGPYRSGTSLDIGYHAGGRALEALTGARSASVETAWATS